MENGAGKKALLGQEGMDRKGFGAATSWAIAWNNEGNNLTRLYLPHTLFITLCFFWNQGHEAV